jgi:hypothetical protein
MRKNMGNSDRLVRLVAGIFLISLVFVGPRAAWGWIGLVPLATAAIGWCPLYSLLGIGTRKYSA